MKARFLLVLLLAGTASAQEGHERSLINIIGDDLSIAFNDGAAYFTSPLRMDETDLRNLAGFAGVTTALVLTDADANRAMLRIRHTTALNNVMSAARMYGDIRAALFLPSALYLGGLASGEGAIRKTGRQMFEALLFSGVVTQSMKWLVGRWRPNTGAGPYEARFASFDFADDHQSMPSGHATVAFAMSAVLAQNIGNTYASAALYGLAAATAISRLYHNRHWLSDVFAGAVIGTASGIFVTSRSEPPQSDHSALRISAGATNLTIEYRF